MATALLDRSLSASPRASQHTGMGAVPYRGGVSFRVWAPHAERAFVTGPWCDWGEGKELASEENGYWSGVVRGLEAGAHYKYRLVTPEGELMRNDPYARIVTSSVGESVVYDDDAFDWQDDAFSMPAWNDLVIYEMHVGTFNDRNPDGPGTLDQAAERLDYLASLGVSAVSMMPLAEFAGDYSWGYNPAFPFAIESAYGGPDAFKRFVRKAHSLGIAVLADVVYNHFGPSDLELWRFDGWGEGEGGGIYFYNDHRADTPWGQTRPDYGRPEVRAFLCDNARMWLDSFRCDGLRWDGTVFIRYKDFWKSEGSELPDGWTLMQEINAEARARGDGKLMIAEDLQGDAHLVEPVEEGGAGFGAQWDSLFVHPMREALEGMHDDERNMDEVARALGHRYTGDAFSRVVYTESHDEVANGRQRLPEEIHQGEPLSWEAQKRSTLGAAAVLTAPGIPMLFQGQEFVEDEWFQDTVPLDWQRAREMKGIRTLYRDLIALRRNLSGTTRGLKGQTCHVHHVNYQDKVVAFVREMEGGPGDTTVVLLNFANRAYDAYRIGLPAGGEWHVRFNSDWKGYSEAFGDHPSLNLLASEEGQDGYPFSGEVSVAPYTAIVLSQEDN
jgi:1,4-alpha-glucan branching enzyme